MRARLPLVFFALLFCNATLFGSNLLLKCPECDKVMYTPNHKCEKEDEISDNVDEIDDVTEDDKEIVDNSDIDDNE